LLWEIGSSDINFSGLRIDLFKSVQNLFPEKLVTGGTIV
jgi:hypothetical protein